MVDSRLVGFLIWISRHSGRPLGLHAVAQVAVGKAKGRMAGPLRAHHWRGG